ncbi:hypothetical protein SAMN05444266_107220 [Chitinophaga jiangningensis]|uniref:TIGR04222 domain-containing protein n=2 Tax=Chitinophaga jiangningensis TaxID=1419482 RepID=A0A1M7HFX1_9BACT|nr:hypothetical protein SAMN05444266_107220 [Chitinophaga jiangningensis]
MTNEEQILWEQIDSFNPDSLNASFTFTHRLARENNWDIAFAERVVAEYKCFIFLTAITDTGVTPSEAVDQAWHLHLTYTNSYWKDLCRNIIGKEIHHNPTQGGEAENKKFYIFYRETLRLYLEKFGVKPPSDIWPDVDERFLPAENVWVDRNRHYVIRRPGWLTQITSTLVWKAIIFAIFLGFILWLAGWSFKFILLGIVLTGIAVLALSNIGGGDSTTTSGGCSGSCGTDS